MSLQCLIVCWPCLASSALSRNTECICACARSPLAAAAATLWPIDAISHTQVAGANATPHRAQGCSISLYYQSLNRPWLPPHTHARTHGRANSIGSAAWQCPASPAHTLWGPAPRILLTPTAPRRARHCVTAGRPLPPLLLLPGSWGSRALSATPSTACPCGVKQQRERARRHVAPAHTASSATTRPARALLALHTCTVTL
jgi:hypothetical protein